MHSRLDTNSIARQLLDPNDPRLRALYGKSALRAMLAIARCWIWIAGALLLAATQPGLPVYAIAFVVIGTQQYALTILSPRSTTSGLEFRGTGSLSWQRFSRRTSTSRCAADTRSFCSCTSESCLSAKPFPREYHP